MLWAGQFISAVGGGLTSFGLGVLYILICMMRGGASLTQICIGVLISSVFSSLLDPAYKATVSDLLTAEEYSKASGLVSLAGSARYLVSPIISGILLSVSDIKLLLVIDICTFILTVLTTFVVRKGIAKAEPREKLSFRESLKGGWNAIHQRRGVYLQEHD
ncbi:MAG: MFS transporter [Phocaeicola sp.]